MELPEDWIITNNEQGQSLLGELKKEVGPEHKLFNVGLTVVARKDGTDDILCRYVSDPERYCLVHLTWLDRAEPDPCFPFVEFDGNFKSFVAYWEDFNEHE